MKTAHDPETGEIIEHAADGSRMPPPAATIADTIRILGDGQFDADVSAECRALVRKMEAHGFVNNGVSKGQMVITLDISLANGAHVITPSYKVKTPVQAQVGTLLFAMEDGRLTRNRPGQGALFGIREVPAAQTEVRDI